MELESIPIKVTDFTHVDTTFVNQNITGLKLYQDNSNYTNIEFYESGKKKFVHPVSDGQCHGKYVDWFEDGKIKWERSYVKGNQIGLSKHYNEKGLVTQIDDNSKLGKDSWTIFEYFDNGQIKMKRSMNQYVEYYPNSSIKCQWDINGEKQFMKLFNENGELVFKGIYNSNSNMTYDEFGKPYTGKIITKFENGNISEQQEIRNELSHSLTHTYHPNGISKYTGKFDNGKKLGIHIFRNDLGEIESYTDYDKNIHKQRNQKGTLETVK